MDSGGVNIKTLLSHIEKRDRALLLLLSKFRLEEKEGKVYLITTSPQLKLTLEEGLRKSLDNNLIEKVVVALEGKESDSNAEQDAPKSEGLNKRFSFSNFVVGEGNRLAYEVAKEVATSLGRVYNPLFIYGEVGLGKTHLLQAIGNTCAERGYRVVYKSANDFSEEMVDAIKSGSIKDFRNNYRRVDILLIDDIQFLSGKERTQIEFFNIFNHMFLSEKQIVLASDRHPKELRDVSDRLVSRFEGGLVVDIYMDEITKIEIIKRKLQELKVEVHDKMVKAIANKTADNVRDIEGTIRGIKLKGVSYVEEYPYKDDLGRIATYTALHLGIKPKDIFENNRSKKVSRARQIAFYLCKKLTDASLIEIARAFNRRDHSTVVYGIKKIEELRKKDRKLNHILNFLEKHIGERL